MTTRRRKRITEQQLAAELHAHRDDPDEWDETAAQAEVSRERSVLMSFRLPAVEFIALQNAAKESGESLSEFVRNAIELRLYGKPVINAVQIASGFQSGTIQSTFLVPVQSAGRSENPYRRVQMPGQFPPLFANMTRST